jgi:transposase
MYDSNKLLPKNQLQWLLSLLPTPRQKSRGRKRVAKEALVTGILQVLVNGVAWGKIAWCGCSYVSCYRYFQELQRRGKLKLIYQTLACKITILTTCAIDTTFVPSFEFRFLTGWSGQKKHRGTKISLLGDTDGLPADVAFGKGNDNDKIFVLGHMKNSVGKVKKVLNLDMSYMSLSLRRAMRQKGIRVNMKVRTQDFTRKRGPKFRFDERKYIGRWVLERTNAWIKNFRRLRLRREYHSAMFKAFVYLALLIILMRHS